MVCEKLQTNGKSISGKEDKDENGNKGKGEETGDKDTPVVATRTFKYNTENVETPAGWKEIGNNLRKYNIWKLMMMYFVSVDYLLQMLNDLELCFSTFYTSVIGII